MLGVVIGNAVVHGRVTHPIIDLTFPFNATHPRTGKPLRDEVKGIGGARWLKTEGKWQLTGAPARPDEWFANAGIAVTINQEELPGIQSLEELRQPVAMLAPNGRQVLVRHRLAGRVGCEFALGWGATWDSTEQMFRIPVTDVYEGAAPRAGILWDQASIDAAYLALTTVTSVPGLEALAATLGASTHISEPELDGLKAGIATIPEWWTRSPFAYQIPGAYSALLGHRLIADPPGLGKTLQAIAVAALTKASRILVTCPPIIGLNWEREFRLCGYEGDIAVFNARRKAPELPESGVVVVPDSLLTNREPLRQQIIDWQPQVFISDEAHRMKNSHSKRSAAALDVAHRVRESGGICVPLTGTPIISGPHELVPVLEFAGLLGPVFGGADAFLRRFCTRDPFGKFSARKSNLSELQALLHQHCWVRRKKEEVLPFLPQRTLEPLILEVDTKPYQEAHEQVIESITEWVQAFREENGAWPSEETLEEYSKSSLHLVSQLRVASAICKVPATVELITEHLDSDPTGDFPLVVWVHHKEVAAALAEALETLEVTYGQLLGGMSEQTRTQAIDDFQAGKLRVIIASITAAGVGVTLTRGSDALFAETDWTPANVIQAIDRQHRIGQQRPVLARMLVALRTLDERIQKVLEMKQKVAGAITGDNQADVAVMEGHDLIGPSVIVYELACMVVTKLRKAG